MVVSEFRTDIPKWASEAMAGICTYCGSYILDNSDTGVTTSRWCGNPSCPGHMMHRMVIIANFFGILGFGPKTALTYIQTHNCKSHFEVLTKWFKEDKPLLTLPEIAVLACIEGYGSSQASKELSHYANFTDYFSNVRIPNQILLRHKNMLIDAEKYFCIKPPLAVKKMLVMGTGSFHGYNNREEFFRLVNEAYGMYVNVIQTGKRKTGVSYLIKENDAVDHSKSQIARECNIPIVTPTEFVSILSSMCPYIPEEDS